jgi:hypothetical protein
MNTKAIGETAGQVWRTLGARKRVALTSLPKVMDQDGILIQQAVGWLARENKVEFEKQGRAVYVRLTAGEAEAYGRQLGG